MDGWRSFGSQGGGMVRTCEDNQVTGCTSAATLYAELTDALRRVQIGERGVSCASLSENLGEDLGLHKESSCTGGLDVSRRQALLDGHIGGGGPTGGLHFSGTFPQVVGSLRESTLEKDYPSQALVKSHSIPISDAGWNMFSASVPVCAFSPGPSGIHIHEGQGGRKRVGSWSKRRKQISHVFLRGLWRWKEGAHARKRRKRTSVGCSCSGSGARSCYASDPPTGHAKSLTGTDSSGELFFGGKSSSQVAWGTDISSTTMDGALVRDAAGGDYFTCWRGAQSDGQSTESGYTSEPDYSADCEFKWKGDFPADEEEDDEEKEPFQLVVWKEMMIPSRGKGRQWKPLISQDCVVELFYEKDPIIRRLHSRLRQRRRSWRTIELCKSR